MNIREVFISFALTTIMTAPIVITLAYASTAISQISEIDSRLSMTERLIADASSS